jgi:hypothetical protein
LYFKEPAALIGTALNIVKNYLIVIFPDSLISSFLKPGRYKFLYPGH